MTRLHSRPIVNQRLVNRHYFLRRHFVVLIGLCLSCYFSYHFLAGERSYGRLMALRQNIEAGQAQLQAIESRQSALLQKVRMMRPGSLDRDLLDQQARAILGYRSNSERTISLAAPLPAALATSLGVAFQENGGHTPGSARTGAAGGHSSIHYGF